MKSRHVLYVFLALIALTQPVWGQVPESITYQAVARDGNQILANENIKVQFVIANPVAVYQEEHPLLTTNQYGLFTLQIGDGVQIGGTANGFDEIDWSQGTYTIEVLLQYPVQPGAPFEFFGTVELSSVPYALYSKRAEAVDNFPMDSLSNVMIVNPQVGEILKWDGIQWVNGPDQGGGTNNIFAGAGISISGDTIINTGDLDPNNDITDTTTAGGDLTGVYPNPEVGGILGREISTGTSLDSGYVLKWMPDSNRWIPMPDETFNVTGGAVNVTPRLAGNGSLGNRLDIAQQGATSGQVLKWDGSFWTPANDSTHEYYNEISGNILFLYQDSVLVDSDVLPGANYIAGAGIDILGNTFIINTGDTNALDDVLLTTPAPSGDIDGDFTNGFTVEGIQGFSVVLPPTGNPNDGEIIKFDFNNFRWKIDKDETDDADPDPANELQVLTKVDTFALELSITGSAVTLPRYNEGAGIDIRPLSNSSFEVINTGDLDPTNDIVIGDTAGGDLGAFYPSPRVEGIWERPIVNTTPAVGEAYLWFATPSGGEWRPAKPVDDDPDPTNEIQELSIANDGTELYLSISNDTVDLPQFTAGPGIDLTNRVITNTGDLNPNNDITDTTAAGGDLIGFYPNPVVRGIGGRPIDVSLTPTDGQVLKWEAGPPSAWIYEDDLVDDADADPENELQTSSLTGDSLGISSRNKVFLADNDSTNEFQDLSLDGDLLSLSNSTDTVSFANFLKVGENLGGDLSDTLPNPTVIGIQKIPVNVTGIQPQQVLKYTGTAWRPANDLVDDADNDPQNEVQDISLTGDDLTLSISGSTVSFEDFVREGEAAGGDLADTFPNPRVVRIQQRPVTDDVPLDGQILKWDDIQGEYVLTDDLVDDADNDTTNELQDLIWNQTSRELVLTQSSQVVIIPDNVNDNDADPTNEIQTLVPEADTAFRLTNGGRIEFPEYIAGPGISIVNRVVFNTGDLNGNDDLLIGATAGGDLDGSYPDPTVDGILGREISNAPLAAGQILKYDGIQWALTQDLFEDADADDQNELQNLSLVDDSLLVLSNPIAPDTIVLGKFVQSGTTAGGDLSGTYPDPIVVGIASIPVDVTGITPNQILKYDGTNWAVANDEVDDADNDPLNEIQTIDRTGTTVTLSNGGGTFQDSVADDDADPLNEIQTIDRTGTTVTLSNGGGTFQDSVADDDADPLNEIQTIDRTGTTVTLSNGGGTFQDSVADDDADPLNEIQTVDRTGTTVTLSNGGGTFQDSVADDDADPLNEIQTIGRSGTTVTLSNGGGTFQDSVADDDADPLNEIQTIGRSGTTVTLSNGGGAFQDSVADDDANPLNEIQSLSRVADTIFLSDGGGFFVDEGGADPDSTNEIQTISRVGTTVTLSKGGGTFQDSVADDDNDPINELQTISKTGSLVTLSNSGGSFVDEVDDADADPLNEIQTINRVNGVVILSDGGGFYVDSVADDDADPLNEIQTISKSGSTITLSNGGGTYQDSVEDDDADPLNEIQTISKSGSTITLSNGGGTYQDSVEDNDADPLNEIQTISKSGTTITLSDGGGTYQDSVADDDADPLNEIQTISRAGTTVTLTNGGGTFQDSVADDDANPLNEIQTISRTGTTVTLSNSGGTFQDSVADDDANPLNEIQTISRSGTTVTLSNSGGTFQDSVIDDDANPLNEIQTISRTGTTVTLSNGGGTFQDSVADNDNDPFNEIQTISYTAGVLTLTNGGGAVTLPGVNYQGGAGISVLGTVISNTGDTLATDDITDISQAGGDINGTFDSLTVVKIQGRAVSSGAPAAGEVLKFENGNWTPAADSVEDDDADPTNEIQALSLVGDSLGISGVSGKIFLEDNSNTNEIQTLTKSGRLITLSGGGSVIDSVEDDDADPLNEIQTVTRVNGVVILSGGGGFYVDSVADDDADPFNEIQSLSRIDDTVFLSGGGFFIDQGGADPDSTNEIQTISRAGTTVTLSKGGGTFQDSVADDDANPLNEIQTISRSGTTVTLSNSGGTFQDSVVDDDASPFNEIQTISRSGVTVTLSNGGGAFQDSVADDDANPFNEIQTISRTGSTVTLSNGGGIFQDSVADDDANPFNEIQTISRSGTTVTLSNSGGTFQDSVADDDANPFNEIQTISRSGTTVTLSNSGGTFQDSVADADADPLNEIQTISRTGVTVTLTNGGGTFIDSVADADADPLNEIQTISRTGTTVTLTNGGGTFQDSVADADADPANELQELSFTNDTLVLTSGTVKVGLTPFIRETETVTGNLSGTYASPTVVSIQDNPVLAGTPDDGEVLTYSSANSRWEADSVQSSRVIYNSDLVPNASGFDLGSSANRWDSLFLVSPANIVSDARLKVEILSLNYGINEIMQLRPVSYRLGRAGSEPQLGLLAQEVQPIIGEVVSEFPATLNPITGEPWYEGSYFGMNYTELIPVLISGVQEQQLQIEAQQAVIEQQQLQIEDMEARLERLEKAIEEITEQR